MPFNESLLEPVAGFDPSLLEPVDSEPTKTLPQFLSEPSIQVDVPVVPGMKDIPPEKEDLTLPKPETNERYQQLNTLYKETLDLLPANDIEKRQQLEAAYHGSLKQIGVEPVKLEKFREGGFIPQVTPQDVQSIGAGKTASEVFAGTQQAMATAVDGMLANPEFFFLGAMPKVMQRTYALAFAGNMAKEVPHLLVDFNDAVQKKDFERAARDLAGAGMSSAFAVALGREATGAAARTRTEAAAGRELLQQVESTQLISPDLIARNVAAPGTLRPTERTVISAATPEAPADLTVLAPKTAQALQEVSLVQKASPELMETAQLVAQRRTELAEPKLPESSQSFTGAEPTPGFLKTAEQKIISRTSAEIPFEALGISPRLSAPAKAVGELVAKALHFYSTPLSERLASEGGTQAKGFANLAKEVSQRAKELYGSVTPSLDAALDATGSLNKTTTWLNNIAPTTNPWGYRNAVNAVERPTVSVPAAHRPTVDLLKTANLDIGKMAMTGIPGFVATGKYQRQPTAFLVDAIRSGRGPAHDLLVRALAAENKMPAARVRTGLSEIKAEFDAPGSQQTVHRIAQEFERKFPKFPTDLKIGGVWTPILHAKPFEYLQNAALSTAQRVAFLERVPQGTLGQLREGVVSELKNPKAFDELVRALHGLPVDAPMDIFTPGSAAGMVASGVNRALGDVFSPLKLTASAIYNIPETFLGNTPAFFGWKNFLKGVIELRGRRNALETMGAINKNIYNWSFDPKAPIRSVMADFRNGVRKVTLQQFFNEMQEMLAASTGQVFAERAQGGRLSAREKSLFADTARAMGFERPAAESMSQGRGTTDQYGDFTRRAASFATGGNMMPAEGSRFGGSRMLGGLFRFQSYPMMKLNAHNKAWRNAVEAVESGSGRRIASSSEQLAKFLFGTAAQGAATAYLAALLRGGETGTEIKTEEAKDEPGEFLLDSLLSGIGGPISAINYAVGSGQGADLLNPENINLGKTFPGSIYMELTELFRGKGAFKDLSMPDALGKYVAEKVPAGRIGRTALAAVGLSQHNTDLDESIRAFYRWRREELGYTQEKSELSEDSRREFRQYMKKAVEKIKQGQDFVPEIVKAAGTEGASRKALASSMRARTILKAPDGKKLSPEQEDALKKRIGEKAYDRIFWHDAMVEAVADRLQ